VSGAVVDVLFEGYAGSAGVAGTVGLIRDGAHTVVVDPGMVPDRAVILDPLRDLGVAPDDVTDVVISHHHPDHTLSIALFPPVPVHDHWAIYHGDRWIDRAAEGASVSDHVRLIETPGHTPQDITTLVDTADGVVAFTHLWWYEGLESDRRATDLASLLVHRERVLALADLIVPGHGAAFEVNG
jgi:glyoxylase-like metal-dependent hydrolase (beta-lactamase superfamily II)